MEDFNKLIEIANDNIKRENYQKEIYKELDLKEENVILFLDSVYIVDGCVVDGNYLFTKEGNRLGVRKNNYYTITKRKQDYVYYGKIYLCIDNKEQYAVIPFEER